MSLRSATIEDLPRIVEIYNAAVPGRLATADTESVNVEDRRQWFENRDSSRHPVLVEERDGKIAGWISLQPFRAKPAYHHTVETSLYIAPEWQGQGIGRAMLAEVLERAPSYGVKTVLGLVFSHNTPSIKVARALGFEEWGCLRDVCEMDGKEYSVTIFGKRVA
jgi:phosphinothricin acetyltransferase